MPAEALTKGPAPTRRSAPSAQKTASAARSISRPQHDDWAAAAPESGEEWTSEPQSAVVAPRARPALPGTQSEEFEYLFHLEKTEPAVATAPKAAGWDEGLERLSIVTLCPTEESWERLRAWIEMYSAQESRRPWICPKAEPPATTDATPAPATPSVSAPPSQKPFDFKASLARGDFPPLSRDQQLAALESADKTSEPKAVPEKSAPSKKPEAGTAAAKTHAPPAEASATPTPQLSRRSPAQTETKLAPATAAPVSATRTHPYVRAASAVLSAAFVAGAVGVFVTSLLTGWRATALPHL